DFGLGELRALAVWAERPVGDAFDVMLWCLFSGPGAEEFAVDADRQIYGRRRCRRLERIPEQRIHAARLHLSATRSSPAARFGRGGGIPSLAVVHSPEAPALCCRISHASAV